MRDTLYCYCNFTAATNSALDLVADSFGIPPQDRARYHTTIAYSVDPVANPPEPATFFSQINDGPLSPQVWQTEDGQNILVLTFYSQILTDRWTAYKDGGASYSYPSYVPHVTLTYNYTGPTFDVASDKNIVLIAEQEHVTDIIPNYAANH